MEKMILTAALSNITPLKSLLALAQGELSLCDVAHVLGITVVATSHQLKLRRDASAC